MSTMFGDVARAWRWGMRAGDFGRASVAGVDEAGRALTIDDLEIDD